MKFFLSFLAALLMIHSSSNAIDIVEIAGGVSGQGTTTRYWDCCKPTCAWEGNAHTKKPIASCSRNGKSVINDNTQSGCVAGGSAYMCSNQQPLVINNTLAYGFAAASFNGAVDLNMCCACVQFTFKSSKLRNKKMIVQITNTGTDALGGNQFDIAIPGGGVGLNTLGCSSQWGTDVSGWGAQYGGVSTRAQCSALPKNLQAGCHWRFDWMLGDSNPAVSFVQVQCPSQLVAISGCKK